MDTCTEAPDKTHLCSIREQLLHTAQTANASNPAVLPLSHDKFAMYTLTMNVNGHQLLP